MFWLYRLTTRKNKLSRLLLLLITFALVIVSVTSHISMAEADDAKVPAAAAAPDAEEKMETAEGDAEEKKVAKKQPGAEDKKDDTVAPAAAEAGPSQDEAGDRRRSKRHRNGQEGAEAQKPEPKKTPSMVKTDSQFMKAIDHEEMAQPKQDDFNFPTNLAGFKYEFNKEGLLRHTETGEPFEFKVREDHSYNQKRYEALGEVITEHVYGLLETEAKLKRVYLPVDATEDEPRSFIFTTEDAMTNPDKLMLLIHGSGVVRAGQWARRLIMNDCLDSGTQLPFIKKAVEEGYGVMVLNTNLNSIIGSDGTRQPIRDNAHPEDHTEYVWDQIVCKAAAKHIAIVAHSYGGVVTTNLAMTQEDPFKSRVFAIAFTDSVHSLPFQDAPDSTCQLFKQVARNWVASDLPLDTKIPSHKADAELVSAGHKKHEWTSWSSFESIFKYFKEKYLAVTSTKQEL